MRYRSCVKFLEESTWVLFPAEQLIEWAQAWNDLAKNSSNSKLFICVFGWWILIASEKGRRWSFHAFSTLFKVMDAISMCLDFPLHKSNCLIVLLVWLQESSQLFHVMWLYILLFASRETIAYKLYRRLGPALMRWVIVFLLDLHYRQFWNIARRGQLSVCFLL